MTVLHPERSTLRQQGLTLVELLVALVIGVVLGAAAVLVYVNSKHAFAVQDNTAQVQENGRFGMHVLKEDLRLAGFWGLNYQPDSIGTAEAVVLTNECKTGWATDVTNPIDFVNNANTGYTACIPDADHKANTDVLTVRHASSQAVADASIKSGNVYLRTSLTSGLIFIADADGAVDSGAAVSELPVSNYELQVHAYYVRPYSATAGDGIPTLVREVIGGTTVSAEPLIEYVEDFQVTFGLDTNGDGDVDRYDNDGIDAADIPKVMTVIAEILVRAPSVEADYTNTRTYQVGDRTHTPNDGFRRQVFRQTIFVRNWSGLTA